MTQDPDFEVSVDTAPDGARVIRVRAAAADGSGPIEREYRLRGMHQDDYLDLHAALAADFGLLVPGNRRAVERPSLTLPYRVLLTENIAPGILYGYGDPAVIRIEGDDGPVYYLVATSNDAPDAFPILRTTDLEKWTHIGFVFPAGRRPAWAATGEGVSDYWAAEMHRVGGRYVVVFTARKYDGELAIGLATADSPEGPFVAQDEPLLAGGVIDSHLLTTRDGRLFLYWKEDSNAVWPGRVVALLAARPDLVGRLFPGRPAARTARFLCAIDAWVATLPPMEQFALHQPLIEAVIEDFGPFRARLSALVGDPGVGALASEALAAMRTRIFGQEMSPDTLGLERDPVVILENDRDWEGHLVEGVWVSEAAGRYYCFYAANDFATANYGVGTAVGDSPLGPFHKADGPFLQSCSNWSGPGHPSVALGPDGRPLLFLHAYLPGAGGYKVFRALLALPIRFDLDAVRIAG